MPLRTDLPFARLVAATATLGLVTPLVACSSGGTGPDSTGTAGSNGGSGGASGSGRGSGGSSSGGAGTAGGGRGTGGGSSGGVGTAGGGGAAGMVSGGRGGMSGTAGGGAAGRGGAGGSVARVCKRGIAANTAPGAAFFPAISWWYNWSLRGTGPNTGIEFVPMAWTSNSAGGAIPAGSKFLLGFNEPNFHTQANLTPQQAATAWVTLQTNAANAGVTTVGPAMNFCGPAANCNGTDPYLYLRDFFTACAGCDVDHVAVHWYNCDLPSLRDYLEPGGNLEGWEQFGRPIWLTEFSCDGSASVAQQEAFMRVAIPYLESKANVFRYSWFSADPIPNARLVNSDGSPTALGQVYISLAQNCP